MTQPAPYPANTLAKGWRFELNMEQVKKSDTWLRARTGFVRANLLLLWSEAWEQTPCGSLPDDDELICLLLDMEPDVFTKHKGVLMRGWWLADDGRLYHETITARVLSMLEKRAKDAKRTADRRSRKADDGATPPAVADVSRVTPACHDPEFDTKHQAPEEVSKPTASHPGKPGERRFEAFWQAYPRKVGKDAARRAFDKRKPDEALVQAMTSAIAAQARSEAWRKDGGQFIPHPSTWLNEGRWQDEGVSVAEAAAPEIWKPEAPLSDAERSAANEARIRALSAVKRFTA